MEVVQNPNFKFAKTKTMEVQEGGLRTKTRTKHCSVSYTNDVFVFTYSFFIIIIFSQYITFCVASAAISNTTTPTDSANINPSNSPTPSVLNTDSSNTNSSHFDYRVAIPIISVSVVFLCVCLVMGFLQALKFRLWRRSNRVVVVEDPVNGGGTRLKRSDTDNSVKKYSWGEIQDMTRNFSQMIGCGGFSIVYLGYLPETCLGAVKIHSFSERLNMAFKQELDILCRIRHENIVQLLGYCDDPDGGGLVLEYIPNGNLQEKLHNVKDDESVASWSNRMVIAFQLAQALEYLHEKCTLQIVHGDIKASNILLDEKLNCKLCDFGSAKMGFSSSVLPPSSLSTSSPRMKQVMLGSPGYTDPSYLRTGIASKKNDIYSYGVLILELITGVEAFCEEKGQLLISIATPFLRDCENHTSKIREFIDPRLGGDFDMEEAMTMVSISKMCLQQSPTLRPSATQILQMIGEKIPSITFTCSLEKKGSKLQLHN